MPYEECCARRSRPRLFDSGEKTAAQLGLSALGGIAQGIVYGAAHGSDTVISAGVADGGNVSAAWLSTDGGSTWTTVTIPADHSAGASISGLGSDGSGLVAVRPGHGANGGADGVAYFSPNGQAWQYAGTIDAAGGWSPSMVKGSTYGFVVTGTTTAGQIVAYTSTGTGGTWLPTGSLGTPRARRRRAPRWAREAPSSPSAPPQAARSASRRCSSRRARAEPFGRSR